MTNPSDATNQTRVSSAASARASTNLTEAGVVRVGHRGAVRGTSLRVRVTEQIAKTAITIGGLTVIIAVLGIMVFLGASVLPLFKGGTATLRHEHQTQLPGGALGISQSTAGPTTTTQVGSEHVHVAIDEYAQLMVVLSPTGRMHTVYLPTGAVLDERDVAAPGKILTAMSFERQRGALALGYADGTVQIGTIGFDVAFVPQDQLSSEQRNLSIGDSQMEKTRELAAGGTVGGYVQRAAADQWRRVTPKIELQEPTSLTSGSGAVKRIDYRISTSSEYLLSRRETGAELSRVRIVRPLGGGKPRVRLESTPFVFGESNGVPDWMFVTGDGGSVLQVWSDGRVERSAIMREGGQGEQERILEADRLRPVRSDERVTSATMLLGSKTLMLGTSQGRVLGMFVVRDDRTATPDRQRVVVAHEHEVSPGSAIRTMGISQRDRSFIAGDDKGRGYVLNMTSGKVIAQTPAPSGGRAALAADIAPKLDMLVMITSDGRYSTYDLESGHSEASTRSLFGRVWYEGESAPSFNYQSSSGEDTAEPKLSLTPLIWGTFKATLYAMLFAVPLAILAAIYTSEMLHPDVKNRVKPVVEAMAALPSVVLGFIAALIIAPFVRDVLPAAMLAFFVVPIGVLLAAYLWQMLPIRMRSQLRSGQHFLLVLVVTLAGLLMALPVGNMVERILFTPSTQDVLIKAGSFSVVPNEQWPKWLGTASALQPSEVRRLRDEGLYFRDGSVVKPAGSITDPAILAKIRTDELDKADIRLWLDGVIGGSWPGWLLLMLGPGLAIAVLLKDRLLSPILERSEVFRSGTTAAVTELVKFFGTLAVGIGFAAILAWILSVLGMDARDSVMGSFNQRNSLVVGIIMGFAIIPIIYTVSEDALSSVSASLRSASLGAGATKWQTAVRVVLPVAASGVFSACMIGLGRAAGETMIVLMASGNTPSVDASMFSGFRALAANIAVELPEAAAGSTHYRVLFLCGLVLLALTFMVNTLAELVRQRFRRRIAGL